MSKDTIKGRTMAKNVKPLKRRTMALGELQKKTLKILRGVRSQLTRRAHEEGLSDTEFLEQVISPFMERILSDREVLRMKTSEPQALDCVAAGES